MSKTQRLCAAAASAAAGILLPMVFHAVPNGGAIFAPMHLPVFICGFICGAYYGALVGFICPVLSFLFTGMPAAVNLPNMTVELTVYGGVSGAAMRIIKSRRFMLNVYLSLIAAMLCGRLLGGLTAYIAFLSGLRSAYSFSVFLSVYFLTCWPAVIIQLAVVPSAVALAKKFKIVKYGSRNSNKEAKQKLTDAQPAEYKSTL